MQSSFLTCSHSGERSIIFYKITIEEGQNHVHIRFTYPFQIFQSYQQGRRSGTPGALGQEKGIHLVGTGDFTHPQWREELKEKLEPEGNGLYKLKKDTGYRMEKLRIL